MTLAMNRLAWTGLCISLSFLLFAPGVSAQEEPRSAKDLTPLQREKLMRAEERAALRARAAEQAEKTAAELSATAAELERIATQARKAADAARRRAAEAEKRAAAFRSTLAPGDKAWLDDWTLTAPAAETSKPPPVAVQPPKEPKVVPPAGDGPVPVAPKETSAETPAGTPDRPGSEAEPESSAPAPPLTAEADAAMRAQNLKDVRALVLASVDRTAEQNKATFLGPKRALRAFGPQRTRLAKTFTYKPGEAPDLADLDLYAVWQWGLNVSRGNGAFMGADFAAKPKTGHIDVARVSFQPDPSVEIARDGMKWGMRRYNLGDATVSDCDFTDIKKEHGVYDSLAGHGLYRGNTFLHLGGQALQIANRDEPFQQYQADNVRFKASPLIVFEDNHAVDTGLDPGRSGFVWTIFDPGNLATPGTVVVRGCTAVAAWDFSRTQGGEIVAADHKGAIRSPGGLVVTNFKERPKDAVGYSTAALVIDACLFDFTLGKMAFVAARGVETTIIRDSVFIARDHKFPHVEIDDYPNNPSGKIILQNCYSPEGKQVWLRIRRKRIMPMHCPGKRIEIDVATLKVTETEMKDDPLARAISPLEDRMVAPGIHPQPPGHVDDIGEIELRYR